MDAHHCILWSSSIYSPLLLHLLTTPPPSSKTPKMLLNGFIPVFIPPLHGRTFTQLCCTPACPTAAFNHTMLAYYMDGACMVPGHKPPLAMPAPHTRHKHTHHFVSACFSLDTLHSCVPSKRLTCTCCTPARPTAAVSRQPVL